MALAELVLGTAQLGLPYGKVNPSSPPDEAASHALLEAAWQGGIRRFDTARSYGSAEEKLGGWLLSSGHPAVVMTKSAVLSLGDDATANARALEESIETSLRTLGMPSVEIFLAHRSDDFRRAGMAEAFASLMAIGRIDGFGASIYEPGEIERFVAVEGLGHVQLPLSLFDDRVFRSPLIEEIRRRGIRLWARSLFLQGVLFMAPDALPPFMADLVEPLRRLGAIADEAETGLVALAIASVARRAEVAGLVVGAHRPDQVRELVTAAKEAETVDPAVVDAAEEAVRGLGDDILDPRRWPGVHGDGAR